MRSAGSQEANCRQTQSETYCWLFSTRRRRTTAHASESSRRNTKTTRSKISCPLTNSGQTPATPADLLTGKDLKAARHERQKARKRLKKPVEQLLADFTPSFRRSWTATTVYDRAEQAERLDEYSGFRLASAVVHGGSAGSRGSLLLYPTDDPEEPHPVMRLGFNPLLAVSGLGLGLIAMKHVADEALRRGLSAAAAVKAQVDHLTEHSRRSIAR